jgi:Tfp pilus assembly protein PilX
MNRLRREGGDQGATLLIVLIIITVVSLVMGAVLTQTDTSLRTSVALRDQTSGNYAADAAAQAIIEQLQNGTLPCSTPSGTATNLGTGSSAFYVPVQTQDGARNAATMCAPDTTAPSATTTTTTTGTGVTIGGGDNNLPSYALLAMGGPSSGDWGIDFSTSANNKTICVENGSVASNTKINATGEYFGVRLTGTGSASDCTTGSGSGLVVGAAAAGGCVGTNGVNFSPTNCTQLSSTIGLPTAPTPTAAITRTDPTPVCKTASGKTYAAFLPGKYTNVSLLNSPCSSTDFEWFSPGTYYFDYGSTTWNWPTTLLAGTPTSGPTAADGSVPALTSVDPNNANTLGGLASIAAFPTSSGVDPTSCADPGTQSSYPGVEFVFGGASTFHPMSGGNAEVCATYSTNSPPIAIWGAQSAISVSGGGVTAESLCSTASCTSGATLISTDTNGQPQFYLKGFVYAPNAPIDIQLKNSYGQVFNWGVVVRDLRLRINGTSPTSPFIKLPKANQGVTTTSTTTYSIRYINVWTCIASSSACSTSGSPNVRVKVQTLGSTYKVLSWSHLR